MTHSGSARGGNSQDVERTKRDRFPAVKNLKPLIFNTAQSSFLAGYLAAGMTKTKKVGTFGGAKLPTVTIFMDGFSQGVDYYNKQKSADVKVLGWDAPTSSPVSTKAWM